MIQIHDKSKCSGCHACANICPKNCIRMIADEEGFLYPQVDETQCIQCGRCDRVCPILQERQTKDATVYAYAVVNKDETVRMQSSSGGVFTLIADDVISRGGVVFGAAFNGDFSVGHICVEDGASVVALRGSKYTQSVIGESYRQAKSYLDAGREVLFTGTPCQIGGLLAFLGKDYDNLITQDLICHGVPSPAIWQKYLDCRKKDNNEIKSVSFRWKTKGWKNYRVFMSFDNGQTYEKTVNEDPMMQVFLKDLCLRPSCYDCAFKQKSRQADITLADFWGIEHVASHMDDDKGTSLVLVHSEKGKRAFERLQGRVDFETVGFEQAIAYNPSMVESVKMPKKRQEFMKEIQAENFEKTARKYCKRTAWQKIKGKIKGILKRLGG